MSFSIIRTPFPIYVSTEEEARRWLAIFSDYRTDDDLAAAGFDTETTGLNIIQDSIRFFSVANEDARICCPLRLLPIFRPLLEDPKIEKRMTNAKYDRHMAMNHGILIRGHTPDTADQSFLLDENRQGRHGLKACAADFLGLRMTPFKQVFGTLRGIDEEVRAMVEVHDILELHDHEGEVEAAHEWALRMLIRLQIVEASPELAKLLKRMDLSLKAGCKLDARAVLGIARSLGLATKTFGKMGYVSDFVQFLGGPELPDHKERPAWASCLEDKKLIEEAHWLLWSKMLGLIDLDCDPIEELRRRVSDYASLDAWASFALVDFFREELEEEEMISEDVELGNAEPITLFEHSEVNRTPFIGTLWNMERRGLTFDSERAKVYSIDMQKHLQRLERAIVKETGELHFNPNSPKQLREVFYSTDRNGEWIDPFGDAPKKMTSGGASGNRMPATSKDVLEIFAGKGNALADLILQFRQYDKLNGTYMVALPEWVDRRGRIHTQLKSTGAVTWRLSSSAPNLQNIPAKDPVWGKKIRQLFTAGLFGDCDPMICVENLRNVPVPDLPDDFPMRLIVADYRQLEMKIMAHFSEDEGMIEAILAGLDLHCQTVVLASQRGVPGIPANVLYDEVKEAKAADEKMATAEQELLAQKRGELKSTGFGIIYGIGALKLGMQLGLPIEKKVHRNGTTRDWCPVAQELIKAYLHDIYPGVGEFIQNTKEQCREELAVYTVLGHPRRLPDIVSREGGLRAQAERQSTNARIQGSGADITNEAMLRCEADEELRRLGVRLLLQIHDELVFEVPDDDRYAIPAKKRIRELMEDPFPMRVPIDIDIEEGYNWGDAKQ